MKQAPGNPFHLCRSQRCRAEIIFLPNRKTGRYLPINASSLSVEERERVMAEGRSDAIDYDSSRHIAHFATCPDAGRFRSPKKTQEGR